MSRYRFENFFEKLTFISIIIRIIFGPLIFYSVQLAAVLNFIVDLTDGEIYKRAGFLYKDYQTIDKILDYYWYMNIIFYMFITNNSNLLLFFLLFVYRTIGQVIYFITKNQNIFFFFPNIFELLFFIFVILKFTPWADDVLNGNIIYYLLFAVLISFLREYILHVRKMNFSWMVFGKTTYWTGKKSIFKHLQLYLSGFYPKT